MVRLGYGEPFAGKDVAAREAIAGRVGSLLSGADVPDAEREAAAILARELVHDAIERVRCALAEAVRKADYLPKDVAFRLAHDVDAVACPFLKETEIFSQDEWRQLVLTISRGARVAVATRRSLSEGIALELAELGDSVVSEALVDNPHAPMTTLVCHAIIERNDNAQWVLDKLAERDGLNTEIVIRLIQKVSTRVGQRLAETYHLPEHTRPVIITAGQAAVLQVIRELPESELLARAVRLRKQNVLTGAFLLRALREEAVPFFLAALAVLSGLRPERVRSIVWHEDKDVVLRLFRAAGIDPNLHDSFWVSIESLRQTGMGLLHS